MLIHSRSQALTHCREDQRSNSGVTRKRKKKKACQRGNWDTNADKQIGETNHEEVVYLADLRLKKNADIMLLLRPSGRVIVR